MSQKLNKRCLLLTALFIAICSSSASAQDEFSAIRISTFARNASFIDKDRSLKLSVLEGDDEIAPEIVEVKPIKQVILAIDNSKSMKYLLPVLTDKLEKCLPDEIKMPTMIVAFNDRVDEMTGFITSKSELKDAIKKIRFSNKNTKLFEVIKVFAKISAGNLTHLILITDGADTSDQTINIKKMLADTNLSISYLNWGLGNPSLLIDEPGYKPNGKSRIVKINPNHMLSTIAQRSGGDVVNYTDWKTLKSYLINQLDSCSYLYSLFWHTDNPMQKFHFNRSKKIGNGNLNRAVVLWRALGDPQEEFAVLSAIPKIYSSMGDYQQVAQSPPSPSFQSPAPQSPIAQSTDVQTSIEKADKAQTIEKNDKTEKSGRELLAQQKPQTETALVNPVKTVEAPAPPQINLNPAKNRYVIQVAAAPNKSVAEGLAGRLREAGLDSFVVQANVAGKGVFHRVRLRGYSNAEAARKAALELKARGLIEEYFITAGD